jgi:alkylation response protein AidB-like acyl-CoA dehydrogenase
MGILCSDESFDFFLAHMSRRLKEPYMFFFVDQQFVLKRIADSAIDIYGMVSVLSRASRSLKEGHESAEHEATITKIFCNEASTCI